MSETKEWRPIVGYEGLYEVSSIGEVRSIGKGSGRRREPRVLAGCIDDGGRYCVTLYKAPGKPRSFKVHGLVLRAFVGPCPEGMECCHNDGNQLNNHVSNLRWDTHIENEKDKAKHGTHHFGEKKGGAILTAQIVERMRDLKRCGASYREIADWLNVGFMAAYQAASGKTWPHLPYAFGWKNGNRSAKEA